MRTLKKILLESSGSEIAEAALVLPLMFTILMGIYWFGRAYNVYATLNYAARDAARAGVAPTCATCGNASLTPTNMAVVVQQDLQNAQIDPTLVQPKNPIPPPGSGGAFVSCNGGAAPSCAAVGGGANICVYQNVYVDDVTISGTPNPDLSSCGVSVSFYYPYQMSLPFTSLNMTQVKISAEAQMVQEN